MSVPRWLRIALPLGLALALLTAGGAFALQKPGRTIVSNGPVRLLALNQGSLAFMVSRSATDCDHVGLWNTDVKGVWRFGKPGPCTNLGSTGAGISALGVSGNRALWVRYNGGNFRDWQLMTASTTQKTPKQLRFVEQDVYLPSPFVIGDSTAGLGIPYAAGNEVVLLGTNGSAVFKHTEPAKIIAVTAGKGPAGAVVAALRDTGEVAMLKADGSLAWTVGYQPGAVKAIALAPAGLIAQLPGALQIRRPTTSSVATLPAGARMTDFAEGRVLYTLNGEVHSFKVSNGADTLLLKGSAKAPVLATQDTHGLGWAQGTSVSYACGGCVSYTP
jgi:hypothetical protein